MSFESTLRRSTKSRLTVSAAGAAAATFAAAICMTALWGFTVDDAWITARVAWNLARGVGYRFNADGPVVDAVTPLGWAPLLSVFAARGPTAALQAARWVGALAWLIAAAGLGARWARLGLRASIAGTMALALTVPLGAWSVSGMETGLVIALCTLALGGGVLGGSAAGLAVAFRPELLPWAVVFLTARAFLARRDESLARRGRAALLAALPVLGAFIAIAVTRRVCFGVAYPLAWLAKPPHAASGLRYAWGALAFCGPAWQLLAWRAYRALSPTALAVLAAVVIHWLVLVFVGGDWMPFYRLATPVLPGLAYVAAELARSAPIWVLLLRGAAQTVVAGMLLTTLGPSARRVFEQRMTLIREIEPELVAARRVAALDIGWVSAATSASIFDAAGVTDPSVARLSGGHTSKRLPEGWLEQHRIDTLVLLADAPEPAAFPELRYVRVVEARIAQMAGIEAFRPIRVLPLRGTNQSYIVARRESD